VAAARRLLSIALTVCVILVWLYFSG